MDIAALSIAMSQQSLGLQVGMAVTKMAMGMSEQTGSQAVEMLKSMELSVEPYKGSQIDIKL